MAKLMKNGQVVNCDRDQVEILKAAGYEDYVEEEATSIKQNNGIAKTVVVPVFQPTSTEVRLHHEAIAKEAIRQNEVHNTTDQREDELDISKAADSDVAVEPDPALHEDDAEIDASVDQNIENVNKSLDSEPVVNTEFKELTKGEIAKLSQEDKEAYIKQRNEHRARNAQ